MTESVKIIDFAIRKGLEFKQYNLDYPKGIHLILKLNVSYDQANNSKHSDVYIALATIPER